MNEQIKKEILSAISSTWNYIGGDVLAAIAGDSEEVFITREEAIEVTLDADRVETHGRLSNKGKEVFSKLSYKEKIDLAKECFPFQYIGY